MGDIPIDILRGRFIESLPASEVAPSDISGLDIYIVRFLHNGIVDADRGGCGEGVFNEVSLAGSGVASFSCIEYGGYFGSVSAEGVEDALRRPQEHAGIPIEFAALHKHFRHLIIRLFCE